MGALLLSWIIFVTVLYLTASRLRRDPHEAQKLKRARMPSRAPAQYDRNGFTRISR